jgi:L-2-hydroxyglutarate oxidase
MKKFIVIGGGLVGLATAWALKKQQPGLDVRLLEKEKEVGLHQSTHNSGVLHAGLYYKPGSLKAQLAVQGIRRMTEFCVTHQIPHEICGKVVVATNDLEVERLRELLKRGEKNGLEGLRWLSPLDLKEVEPHAQGKGALHVPQEGIVDYAAVCKTLRTLLQADGAQVRLSTQVTCIRPEQKGWRVETTTGDFPADFVINCAGLHCDRVAELAGEERTARIVPFRGEYYRLKGDAQKLVRNLVYPVPDPTFPFLGVHFTRLIQGGVEAGPNAVLAFAREGYTKWNINLRDLADAAFYPGLRRFMQKHRGMAWDEVLRSFSKRLFCASLQKLVPEVQVSDLEPGGAGVRAQAMLNDGTLVQDFHVMEKPNALHVLNAPSPAATASLSIGEHLAQKAVALAGMG